MKLHTQDLDTGPGIRLRQKRRTRARLLRAARTLFARQGIHATRTMDVAEACGVSHGTVFAHFPRREDLEMAVIHDFGQRLGNRLGRLVAEGSTVREVLEAHLEAVRREEAFYARLVIESPMLPHQARTALLMFQSAVSFYIYRAVEREMGRDVLRRIPMAMLFNTWIGLLHHYVTNRDLFAPRGSVIARCGRDILEHYLRLVGDMEARAL